ncbi:MFS general substrate transporter, partial [Aureobasidium melanogenum]|uniref:MFS general substrate transporter n=1 Tax=Aureobasidium melanogenum (strain CBS 110374) TaxID=1043003 RepID=A0A074W1E0_AURM1
MARSKSSSESLPSASSPTEKAPVVPNEQAAPNPEVVANGNEKDVEAAPPAPPPNFLGNIPDGGLQAWLQVAAGWSLFFNTWGENHVFGVFQTYYESGVLIHASSSNISWVGAIQSYCVLLLGFLSGPIFDRGYLRPLLVVGSFLVVFGFMMLSLCHTFWQVLLAQGFCIGIGSGLLFVPAVAILPTYFRAKLGLAVGLAACGSSMGGIIYPIVFYRLLDQIGFGWSVRVLGFLALATLLVPIFVMKQRVKPPKARALIDTSVFKDIPFMVFVVGAMVGFIGLYTVLFYISFFGESKGYTDASMSFYIVPILNAASVFGRTLPNALSDKTGSFNIILPGAAVCSILIFCMIAVDGLASIIVLAVLFGFFSGVFIALPPVCLVALTADKSRIGSRIGMAFAFMGFGTLAGGPGGGAILQNYGPKLQWTGLWIYGGVACAVAAAMFTVVRMMKAGGKLMVKV